MGFLVTLAGAVFFAFHGSLSLLPIESRPLGSTLVIIAGLLLAMLPNALLLGLPGYAIKRCLPAGLSALHSRYPAEKAATLRPVAGTKKQA
jgi:hypothetical protein